VTQDQLREHLIPVSCVPSAQGPGRRARGRPAGVPARGDVMGGAPVAPSVQPEDEFKLVGRHPLPGRGLHVLQLSLVVG
jgi:hypothetical protein